MADTELQPSCPNNQITYPDNQCGENICVGVSEVLNRWHSCRSFFMWWRIVVLLSGCHKFSYFSMKITDEFISKFKFISVQLIVCDVIYFVCVLELLDILSDFLL